MEPRPDGRRASSQPISLKRQCLPKDASFDLLVCAPRCGRRLPPNGESGCNKQAERFQTMFALGKNTRVRSATSEPARIRPSLLYWRVPRVQTDRAASLRQDCHLGRAETESQHLFRGPCLRPPDGHPSTPPSNLLLALKVHDVQQ